jgi:hypothetical protein
MLALAELGFPGLFLFSMLVYVSTKIPWVALRRYSGDGAALLGDDARAMRAWAMGLFAAFIGLALGIFFLSFTYHYVLWIYMGLSGALFFAARRHDPEFSPRIGWRDVLLVGFLDALLVVGMFVVTRGMLG